MFKPLTLLASLLAMTFVSLTVALAGDLSSIDKVYVAEVSIADDLANRKPTAFSRGFKNERAVTERDLARKADDLKEELERRLGKTKSLVDAPGPDVVTVKAEIVELKSSRPTMADYKAEIGLSYESLFAGGATVDVHFLVNGEEISSLTVQDYGTLSDPIPVASTWDHANDAFRKVARKVANQLN